MSRAIKMLLEKQWITREQYDAAMVSAARYGETPGYHLVNSGAISDDDLVDFFMRYFSLRYWPLFKLKSIPRSTIELMSPRLAKHLRVLPVLVNDKNLTLGLTDPSFTHVAEEASFHSKRYVSPVIISESDMTWALEYYYGITSHAPSIGLEKLTVSKQPATLERETHDIIGHPEAYAAPSSKEGSFDAVERSGPRVIHATENGWGIDDWDMAPEKRRMGSDEAIPLLTPAAASPKKRIESPSSIAPIGRSPGKIQIKVETKTKSTLPPPAFRPSQKDTDKPSGDPYAKSTIKAPLPEEEKESGPVPKRNIADILGAINQAGHRDDIINLAIDFLLLFSKRAAFLTIRKNEIRGYEIRGENTNRTAFKSYWIPLSSSSTFRRVAVDGQIHLGPYGRTSTDSVFTAALGGRPRRVLIIPIEIQNRAIGLFYADTLRIDMPPWNLLERLSDVVGSNFEKLIRARTTKI